jgi:hypothetical protein
VIFSNHIDWETVMIYKDIADFIVRRHLRSITIPFLVIVAPAAAIAGPPTQLYGKSISLKWDEDKHNKYPSGEEEDVSVNRAVGIYVSSQGRMFSRIASNLRGSGPFRMRPQTTSRGVPGLAAAQSSSPDGSVIKTSNSRYNTKWEFHGRSLVGFTALESGARRLTVNFDESFRTCTIDVSYGKESGVPGTIGHALNGRLIIVTSQKVSAQSCTVSDGNMFGGGDNG